MKKIIKRILIAFLATVLVAVIVLISAAYLYRDKIESLIVTEINEQVAVPIDIKGGIRFSLIKNFPFASITLYDVSIKNKLKGGPENFIKVKELLCLFNMWELAKNKIEIKRIHFYDGEVNIYMDDSGNGDYEIMKPSRDTTKTSQTTTLNLNLQKAVVKNIHFTYLTERREEDIQLKIEKLTLGGNFQNERFDLETSEKMIIERLRLNGEDYLNEKTFNSDITIDVNQKENRFTLNKADLEIAGNRFNVTGYLLSGKKKSYVDFSAKTQGKDIAKVIALIPVKFKSMLAGAEGSGAFEVEATVSGGIKAGINPNITVNAKLNKARVTIPSIRKPLTDITVDAVYRMDSVGDDALTIRKFHSEFDGQPQNFDLRLVHLSDPDFVLNADGVANLHDLRTFFSDSVLQEAEGLVTFDRFHIEGSKKGFSDPTRPRFKASGNFSLKNVEVKTGGITYGNMNGRLEYDNEDISIKGFTLKFLNTDISFDGRVTSILAYILSRDKKNNNPDVALGLDGKLHIKTLNIGKLMAAYSGPPAADAAPKKAAPAPPSGPGIDPRDIMNIQGNLNISIDKLIYQKMIFEHVSADLGLSPYRLDIRSLSTHTMGGDISDQGSVQLTADRQMIFDFGLNIDKVDLPVLFRECQNFGQTTLTDKNLKGILTADLELNTVWNNYTDIDLSQVKGTLNCHVLKGELNDFGPIKSLATFVKISELNHIVFSELSNQLVIKDKVITIPMMEIQSSAINMMMAGTHTMDNVMDYQIKVNLRKLLAAKFGRKENDDEYIESNPYEGVNLYLTVTGSIDHPVIKYDKKTVKKKLKADLAEQKQELKEIFGKDKHKKVKGDDAAKREEKYYDTRKKPEFIEFEDDSAKGN